MGVLCRSASSSVPASYEDMPMDVSEVVFVCVMYFVLLM